MASSLVAPLRRITHFIPHLDSRKGGVTTSLYNQVQYEASCLPSSSVSIVTSDSTLSFSDPSIKLYIAPLCLQRYCFPSFRLIVLGIRLLLESDVVHIHSVHNLFSLGFIFLSSILRKRIVIHPHGMLAKSHNRLSHLPKQLSLLIMRISARNAYIRYLNTNEMHSSIACFGRPVIIPNLYYYPSTIQSHASFTSNSTLAPCPLTDCLKCVFVGRLHPIKRIHLQLQAVKLLADAGYNVTLSIIGPDDGDQASLAQYVSKTSIGHLVSFIGPVPYNKIPHLISQFNLLLLTSFSEADPMTLRDGLANSVPVLLTDNLRHMSKLAPDAIVLAPPSAASIADTLCQLLNNPKTFSSLQEAASKFRHQDSDSSVHHIFSLYHAVQ